MNAGTMDAQTMKAMLAEPGLVERAARLLLRDHDMFARVVRVARDLPRVDARFGQVPFRLRMVWLSRVVCPRVFGVAREVSAAAAVVFDGVSQGQLAAAAQPDKQREPSVRDVFPHLVGLQDAMVRVDDGDGPVTVDVCGSRLRLDEDLLDALVGEGEATVADAVEDSGGGSPMVWLVGQMVGDDACGGMRVLGVFTSEAAAERHREATTNMSVAEESLVWSVPLDTAGEINYMSTVFEPDDDGDK